MGSGVILASHSTLMLGLVLATKASAAAKYKQVLVHRPFWLYSKHVKGVEVRSYDDKPPQAGSSRATDRVS